jgi:putative ABC transport system permease protein
LAVRIVLMAVHTAAVVRIGGVGKPAQVLYASARAVLQLAVVAALVGFVLRSLLVNCLFLAAMVVVASGTAARRITGTLRPQAWCVAVPITAGAGPTMGLTLASTAVPLEPVALLPTLSILIGNAMIATSIAGRRVVDELHTRWGEFEAALSIGLERRDAANLIAKPAAALGLLPRLDQARTVGLVTLPGAFVGVLLAGASRGRRPRLRSSSSSGC